MIFNIKTSFSVRFLDVFSDGIFPSSGVPQGSKLGPLLFLIYINDLPDCIKNSFLLIYADDCKISMEIKSPFDAFKLQADLGRMSEWGDTNHIPLNVSKCKVLRFCRSNKCFYFDYKLNDISLEVVFSFNDLGVTFSNDFTFNKHIESVISRASRNLGWIKRTTKFFTDIGSIKVLFNSFVLSHLTFASSIWSPYVQDQIDRIERVEHIFIRYLAYKDGNPMSFFNHNYYSNSVKFSIPTVMSLHNYYDCIFAYLCFNKIIVCEPLNLKFTERDFGINIRKSRHLKEVTSHKDYTHFSALNRILRYWNSLPDDLRQLKPLSTFKRIAREQIYKYL